MATAAAVAESRGDLLAWLNDLLQLNIGKIEQVGTGAPICQIFDSIFGMQIIFIAIIIDFKVTFPCTSANSIHTLSMNTFSITKFFRASLTSMGLTRYFKKENRINPFYSTFLWTD